MYRTQIVTRVWLVCLLGAAAIIIVFLDQQPSGIHIPQIGIMIMLFVVSAFCEYIDSSLGMGYGTTLTPLLLSFGAVRQELVPAILLSELITGFMSGIAHHKVGNINLKKNKNIRTALPLLALPSVVGVVIATFLGARMKSQGQHYANLYIGFMITAIGVYLIYLNFRKRQKKDLVNISPSLSKLVCLGTIASFNKGLSGGGYGPLLTGGQLLSGINEKEAVVITSLCECFTCLTGLVVFFALGGVLNLFYAIPLCLGSVISVFPAANTIKILKEGMLKKSIGWATLLLGILTLLKFLI
jgi:uncharacterized membrane protein YfcA